MILLVDHVAILAIFMVIFGDQINKIQCDLSTVLDGVVVPVERAVSDIGLNFPPFIQNPTTRALCPLRTVYLLVRID